MKLSKKPNSVSELALNFILYATIGTLCAALLDVWLKFRHIGAISKELLFLPWAITLVMGVFAGYGFGVKSERERTEKAKQDGQPQ